MSFKNTLGLSILESLRQETKSLFEKSELNFSCFTWSSLCSGKINLDLKKPNSSVPGDIPKVLIKDKSYEFTKPATKIFNRIVQTADWEKQWPQEHITVIPKSKTDPPQKEHDLRNIAKTARMSKLCEALLGDFLLPVVDPFLLIRISFSKN